MRRLLDELKSQILKSRDLGICEFGTAAFLMDPQILILESHKLTFESHKYHQAFGAALYPEMGVFAPPSPFFKNVQCVRETEIQIEQQPPQGVFVCDHAGRVINTFYPSSGPNQTLPRRGSRHGGRVGGIHVFPSRSLPNMRNLNQAALWPTGVPCLSETATQ